MLLQWHWCVITSAGWKTKHEERCVCVISEKFLWVCFHQIKQVDSGPHKTNTEVHWWIPITTPSTVPPKLPNWGWLGATTPTAHPLHTLMSSICGGAKLLANVLVQSTYLLSPADYKKKKKRVKLIHNKVVVVWRGLYEHHWQQAIQVSFSTVDLRRRSCKRE